MSPAPTPKLVFKQVWLPFEASFALSYSTTNNQWLLTKSEHSPNLLQAHFDYALIHTGSLLPATGYDHQNIGIRQIGVRPLPNDKVDLHPWIELDLLHDLSAFKGVILTTMVVGKNRPTNVLFSPGGAIEFQSQIGMTVGPPVLQEVTKPNLCHMRAAQAISLDDSRVSPIKMRIGANFYGAFDSGLKVTYALVFHLLADYYGAGPGDVLLETPLTGQIRDARLCSSSLELNVVEPMVTPTTTRRRCHSLSC